MEVSILNAELEIDNNRIENAIRPLKLGLKNYLFMGSAEAGKDSALFYPLIENCKVHDLDPEVYLVEVIELNRTVYDWVYETKTTQASHSTTR
jgi:hypothetical protein